MSQADFLAKIRKEVPELATFKDNDVMDKIFQTRPEIRDMIETPDDVAARNQLQLEQKAQTQSSFTRSVLDALPGVGGVLGAVGGEGVASVPLSLLGVAGGKGLRDIISQGLGLENPTSLGDKFLQSGKEAAIAGLGGSALHAVGDFANSPIQSLRTTVDDWEPQILKKINPKIIDYFLKGPEKSAVMPDFKIDVPESNEPVSIETPKADTKINNAKKVTLHLN